MKRIVLSYAKTAWEIGTNPTFGAGFIANDFYKSIRKIFPEYRIEYLDHSEFKDLGGFGKIEYFFGISSNFDKFVKHNRPEKAILISVNHNSIERRLIKKIAKKNTFSRKLLDSHDGITSNIKDTKYADYILSLGNWNSITSYLQSGISIKKLYPITFNYFPINTRESIELNKNNVIIFFGSLNFRKGIDKIPEILDFLSTFRDLESVTIIGKSKNNRVYDYVYDNLPNTRLKVTFIQHLDFKSKEFSDLKKMSKFAIYPSREEGLAATVLDLIVYGIPVIHSEVSGIEITSSLCNSLDFEDSNWQDKLRFKIYDIDRQLNELACSQRIMYKEMHQNNFQLDRVLARIKKDNLWPTLESRRHDYSYVNYSNSNLINHAEFKLSFDTTQMNINGQSKLMIKSNETYFIEKSISLLDRFQNIKDILVTREGNNQFLLKISKSNSNRNNLVDKQPIHVYSSSLLEKNQTPIKFLRVYYFQELVYDTIFFLKAIYNSKLKKLK